MTSTNLLSNKLAQRVSARFIESCLGIFYYQNHLSRCKGHNQWERNFRRQQERQKNHPICKFKKLLNVQTNEDIVEVLLLYQKHTSKCHSLDIDGQTTTRNYQLSKYTHFVQCWKMLFNISRLTFFSRCVTEKQLRSVNNLSELLDQITMSKQFSSGARVALIILCECKKGSDVDIFL